LQTEPGSLDTLAATGIGGFLDMKHVHEERTPLRRNTTHEEVGNAALFLCSELSSGITGTIWLPYNESMNTATSQYQRIRRVKA